MQARRELPREREALGTKPILCMSGRLGEGVGDVGPRPPGVTRFASGLHQAPQALDPQLPLLSVGTRVKLGDCSYREGLEAEVELPQVEVGVGEAGGEVLTAEGKSGREGPRRGAWGGEGITQMFRICRASNAKHYRAPDPTGGNTHAWPRLQASPQLLSSSGLGEAPACCPEQQPQTGVSLKSPRPEGPALLWKTQVLCDASKTKQPDGS